MTFTGTLTPGQLAETIALRDEWMRTALSTGPCDRPRAEATVHAAYAAAGIEPPPLTIWMGSPLGGVFAKTILRQHIFKPDQLGDQLGDQLRGQLRGQLWGQLGGQLGGQLWDEIPNNLSPWYEAYWISTYTKALTFAGLPASERLDTLSSAVAETGWWWPMQGAVVLTDRPTALHRDQQGRLHHETGPAITYGDGWGGSYWHGNHVPDDLVAGDGWSPERILTEPNVEIRRAAIEKRGWDRFVADAELQLVATKPDPGNPGQDLNLYDLPHGLSDLYGEPARILLVANASLDRDGARRRFGLPVPAEVSDPVAAAATLFDISPAEYAALGRAT